MTETRLGAGRIFADNYQFVVCDDPERPLEDDENWADEMIEAGVAGAPPFRMFGTEADGNDHWVELVRADAAPDFDDWARVICAHFQCGSGRVCVMSVADVEASIAAEIAPGDYAVYLLGQNIGVDRLALGEEGPVSDAELAARKDLEWYCVWLTPGTPEREGRLKDEGEPLD